MFKAIAQAVVNEERRREQSDNDLMTIIVDVRNRFDAMEVRAAEVAALRATIDELRGRLDKLEAASASRTLKVAR